MLFLSCHTQNLPGSLKTRQKWRDMTRSLLCIPGVNHYLPCQGQHATPAFRKHTTQNNLAFINDLSSCWPIIWSAWVWVKRQSPFILTLYVCIISLKRGSALNTCSNDFIHRYTERMTSGKRKNCFRSRCEGWRWCSWWRESCIDSEWMSNASSGLCIIIGHSNLIFGFWSYPSFLHDAGGWVIKTIGLCYPFMKSQPLHILCSRSRFCNVSESLLAARWDCSSSHEGCWKVFQRSANAWELHSTFQNYTLCSPHKLNQKLKINLEWPSITQVLYFASWDVMLV